MTFIMKTLYKGKHFRLEWWAGTMWTVLKAFGWIDIHAWRFTLRWSRRGNRAGGFPLTKGSNNE